MAAGTPLADEDRWPWLRTVRDWLSGEGVAGRSTVVTCSALRRVYRDVLRDATGGVVFVHLDGDAELIGQRLRQRRGHFMPPALLRSQLDTLEPLGADEDSVTIRCEGTADLVAAKAHRGYRDLVATKG